MPYVAAPDYSDIPPAGLTFQVCSARVVGLQGSLVFAHFQAALGPLLGLSPLAIHLIGLTELGSASSIELHFRIQLSTLNVCWFSDNLSPCDCLTRDSILLHLSCVDAVTTLPALSPLALSIHVCWYQ